MLQPVLESNKFIPSEKSVSYLLDVRASACHIQFDLKVFNYASLLW